MEWDIKQIKHSSSNDETIKKNGGLDGHSKGQLSQATMAVDVSRGRITRISKTEQNSTQD